MDTERLLINSGIELSGRNHGSINNSDNKNNGIWEDEVKVNKIRRRMRNACVIIFAIIIITINVTVMTAHQKAKKDLRTIQDKDIQRVCSNSTYDNYNYMIDTSINMYNAEIITISVMMLIGLTLWCNESEFKEESEEQTEWDLKKCWVGTFVVVISIISLFYMQGWIKMYTIEDCEMITQYIHRVINFDKIYNIIKLIPACTAVIGYIGCIIYHCKNKE